MEALIKNTFLKSIPNSIDVDEITEDLFLVKKTDNFFYLYDSYMKQKEGRVLSSFISFFRDKYLIFKTSRDDEISFYNKETRKFVDLRGYGFGTVDLFPDTNWVVIESYKLRVLFNIETGESTAPFFYIRPLCFSNEEREKREFKYPFQECKPQSWLDKILILFGFKESSHEIALKKEIKVKKFFANYSGWIHVSGEYSDSNMFLNLKTGYNRPSCGIERLKNNWIKLSSGGFWNIETLGEIEGNFVKLKDSWYLSDSKNGSALFFNPSRYIKYNFTFRRSSGENTPVKRFNYLYDGWYFVQIPWWSLSFQYTSSFLYNVDSKEQIFIGLEGVNSKEHDPDHDFISDYPCEYLGNNVIHRHSDLERKHYFLNIKTKNFFIGLFDSYFYLKKENKIKMIQENGAVSYLDLETMESSIYEFESV